jgi:hypothetical protein
MTNEKLLGKLGGLLESSKKADAKHVKKLRKVLHKLKKRQKELGAKLEQVEGEHERRKITQEIEVLKLQRKKGVVVYKSLKKASADPEDSV